MSICLSNYSTKTVTYCGAGRPVLYKIENELFFLKGNLQSVGYDEDLSNLEVIKIPFNKGLRVYLHSDGLQDQFGGDSLKKYSQKQFVLLTPPPERREATNSANAQRAQKLVSWLLSKDFTQGAANLHVFDFFGLLADEKGFFFVMCYVFLV